MKFIVSVLLKQIIIIPLCLLIVLKDMWVNSTVSISIVIFIFICLIDLYFYLRTNIFKKSCSNCLLKDSCKYRKNIDDYDNLDIVFCEEYMDRL